MEETLKQQPANIIKIVLFGPESTGKTTLSRQLAQHYNTVWAPEYAREYLQEKWNTERKICEPSDIIPIARGQIKSENELSGRANRVLICDTDLLETKIYSEVYFEGFVDPMLDANALKNQYDLYLLTYIDTPWEQDDLRDKPKEREEMFNIFETALITFNRPYLLLKGDEESRLTTAINATDELLGKSRLDAISSTL